MEAKSGSSSANSRSVGHSSKYVNFNGERRFPKKCVCGSDVSIYTSQSKLNPGRPYFRCVSTREDGHLFKWVEDGMFEEIKELLQKTERIQEESEIVNSNMEELKNMIHQLEQEGKLQLVEIRKLKIQNTLISVCLIVLAFIIMYHIMFGIRFLC